MAPAPESALAAVVTTSQGEYRVLVARASLGALAGEMRRAGLTGRAFVIADRTLYPASARLVQDGLEAGGFPAHLLAIPSGEEAKNLGSARRIYEWLAGLRAERGDAVVAVGGGVIGDLAGFAAATWLRGVPFVQVPTTLAAMVDASLGGKVAVNLPEGKNLVGAFHQPRLVLADVDFLNTLPRRELAAGWAEAIKHGLILDEELLGELETHTVELQSLAGERAVRVIRRSAEIKARVVSEDEFETGDIRVVLNYGHTVGHALETVTEYGRYLHGEAVSIGMMAAARISLELGLAPAGLLERQARILSSYGLPLVAEDAAADEVLDAMRSDKKTQSGSIRWVLLAGAGRAVARRDVPDDVVRGAVKQVTGG